MSVERVEARGRRWPVAMRTEARRLVAAGWNSGDVRRLLMSRYGAAPAGSTIRLWADAEQAARHEEVVRRGNRRHAAAKSGRLTHGRPPSVEFKVARIRALWARRMPARQIANVINFDFGDSLSEYEVRMILQGRLPLQWGGQRKDAGRPRGVAS